MSTITLAGTETLQGKAGANTALVVTVWGAENAETFIEYKLLARVTLTTSASTILTADGQTIIKKIIVQSIHASDQTVELWVNGNADANRIYKGTVNAGGANHPLEGIRLDSDGTPLPIPTGGGAAIPIKEAGASVVATPVALDFTHGVDVTNVSSTASVAVDEAELDGRFNTLLLPTATSPAQTADGSLVWDSDDDRLTIGDGAARKTFLPSDAEFIQATHAQRIAGTAPVGAHVAGRLVRETDTGLIYYDNGSTWDIWMGDGYVRKTANETINNSLTLQDDDHLFWPVEANEIWFFEAFLLQTAASANADWRYSITGPAGATASWHTGATTGNWTQVGTGANQGAVAAIGATLATGAAAVTGLGFLAGWMFVSSTAGTARLQWAQNVATAENNVILANSFLRIRRLA